MAWQSEPHEILWLAPRDGVLVGFTYNREQEMTAWHRHNLGGGGRAEALAVIPGAESDELWLSVARLINGQTRRYIELMTRGLPEGGALADSFFVDSGKTVTGRGLSVISGLGHLEGCEVSILIVSVDTGHRGFDGGRAYGIDHIAVLVRHPESGALMVSESTSDGDGVRLIDLDDWQKRMTKSGASRKAVTRFYAVDPLKEARNRA